MELKSLFLNKACIQNINTPGALLAGEGEEEGGEVSPVSFSKLKKSALILEKMR